MEVGESGVLLDTETYLLYVDKKHPLLDEVIQLCKDNSAEADIIKFVAV